MGSPFDLWQSLSSLGYKLNRIWEESSQQVNRAIKEGNVQTTKRDNAPIVQMLINKLYKINTNYFSALSLVPRVSIDFAPNILEIDLQYLDS